MDNVFGKRLAETRRRRGLKQVELAALMGEKYDQPLISAVEHGKSGLRRDGLVSAVRELRVSTDYLYGLADDSREVSELLVGDREGSLPGVCPVTPARRRWSGLLSWRL